MEAVRLATIAVATLGTDVAHRHLPPYRVSVRIGGNAPRHICRQARANPRFKHFHITGRHRGNYRANTPSKLLVQKSSKLSKVR